MASRARVPAFEGNLELEMGRQDAFKDAHLFLAGQALDLSGEDVDNLAGTRHAIPLRIPEMGAASIAIEMKDRCVRRFGAAAAIRRSPSMGLRGISARCSPPAPKPNPAGIDSTGVKMAALVCGNRNNCRLLVEHYPRALP
jgi:hypothetical protein